jgi:hypothetical protein
MIYGDPRAMCDAAGVRSITLANAPMLFVLRGAGTGRAAHAGGWLAGMRPGFFPRRARTFAPDLMITLRSGGFCCPPASAAIRVSFSFVYTRGSSAVASAAKATAPDVAPDHHVRGF